MDKNTLFAIVLSLKVTLISTLFAAVFGGFAAYILAFKKFWGKNTLETVMILPIALPPTVTGYYLMMLFGKNGFLGKIIYSITGNGVMFSWTGAVIAASVVATPLMIIGAKAAFESVDKTMIHTSTILGYSEAETALNVILPLAKKGIFAGIILAFIRALGEFGATVMLAGNIPGKTTTIPLAIYLYASSGEMEKVHMLAFILLIISGLFIFVYRKMERKNES